MYKLIIEARIKSKAKIFGVLIPQYVFGENFEVFYIIKNIGKDTVSPKGRFLVEIIWQGTTLKETQWYDIPTLKYGEDHYTGKGEWGVLSHLGTFHITNVESDEDPNIKLNTFSGIEITPIYVIGAIFGSTKEGVYEYWALVIASFGFLVIVVEKIIPLLSWLINNSFL